MSLVAQIDIGRALGLVLFGLIGAIALELFWILVMHMLMPRKVLERYWKSPHFQAYEIAMYTDTCYAPMRTIMLMSAIAFPRLGIKRGVAEANKLAPWWFRAAAIALVIWILAVGLVLVVTIFALGIYLHMAGEIALWPSGDGRAIDWRMSATMLILIAGIAFMLVKIFRK
jgi:hypothetical protein